jgi:hypothetical protein
MSSVTDILWGVVLFVYPWVILFVPRNTEPKTKERIAFFHIVSYVIAVTILLCYLHDNFKWFVVYFLGMLNGVGLALAIGRIRKFRPKSGTKIGKNRARP